MLYIKNNIFFNEITKMGQFVFNSYTTTIFENSHSKKLCIFWFQVKIYLLITGYKKKAIGPHFKMKCLKKLVTKILFI